MEIEAIVAEIDDDGLLGVDILQNGGNGPADLLMSKSVMVFNNKEVPMIQVGITNRVRKVKVADDFVVPSQSDCLIDVNLERQEYNDVSRERNYIAEPTEHFQAEYPLLMASTLADIKEAATCKVRMLNPFPTAIPIKQDAIIGKEQPIASKPRVIGSQRDNSEVKTHTTLRRIKPFKEETSQSFSENGENGPYISIVWQEHDVPHQLRQPRWCHIVSSWVERQDDQTKLYWEVQRTMAIM